MLGSGPYLLVGSVVPGRTANRRTAALDGMQFIKR